MKMIGNILMGIGALLFFYAIVGRFVNGDTVFGYIYPLEAKTVVLGANSIMLLGICASMFEKK